MTPKATIKPEKKDYVEDLAQQLKSASSSVFVDFTGMGVVAQQELKSELRSCGGKMLVAKNTLLKLAGKAADLPEDTLTDEVLSGQTALVLSSDDAVAPIQILGKYSTSKELGHMKAGVVEGIFQNKESLLKISKLPGKQELYAKVVGGVASPMYGLVGTLQGNLNKLVWVLKAKVDQSNS